MIDMTKSKSKSEVEELRGLLRNAKKQIKNLQKQLARANKHVTRFDSLLLDIDDDAISPDLQDYRSPKEEAKDSCSKCKQELEILVLGSRTLFICPGCGHTGSRKT